MSRCITLSIGTVLGSCVFLSCNSRVDTQRTTTTISTLIERAGSSEFSCEITAVSIRRSIIAFRFRMSNTLENPVVIRRSASKSCRVGFSDPELRSNVLSTSAGGFTTEDTTGDFEWGVARIITIFKPHSRIDSDTGGG